MFTFALILFYYLLSVRSSKPHGDHHTHVKECTNQVHHQERAVAETTTIARRLLDAVPNSKKVPLADRLAVMMLFSHGFTPAGNKRINKSRLDHFECTIRKLKANLMEKTHVDVFIWVMNSGNETSVIPAWLNSKDFPHVHILSIHPDSWKVPCHLKPPKTWTMLYVHIINYRLDA